MSGPVWRLESGNELTCDECLRTNDRVLAEGRVVEAEFLVNRRMCEACYERNIALIAAEAGS